MTRLHWILAVAVLATWIPSYAIFFHRDLVAWWRQRTGRRKARADLAAAQARLNDELAAKYMPPGADPGRRG